ncbi:murein L,D-transpeptidase catalytic domain family protein [Legionella gresilensis]|uniref:murein L,D-transpeptidase catalytic domain family protein n=1 Tax=Legionella gresilensis TaxID=91823 RepID=UPI001041092B|nr:murein L,D-transpeptidase catalytic domain family protein [Legionella gresilensis]
MIKGLLLYLAVTSACFAMPPLDFFQQKVANTYNLMGLITSIFNPSAVQSNIQDDPFNDIKAMLENKDYLLSDAVINKVLTTLRCATTYNVAHNNILAIIDYSLPSSEKRLWVFDLNQKKLLFHTYVSHGINSGTLLSNYFSNKYNSKASSIGVYETDKAYRGREGLSLQLTGLDQSFNDNAAGRAIVIHPGWYVEENFIKKYGRAGRSWGCPALPEHLSEAIINTIKDKALLVIYYPNDKWFAKSKFLNCDNHSTIASHAQLFPELQPDEDSIPKEEILFADLNKNNKREENEPILAITADNYERLFQIKVPLSRMLRRQINNTEYVALNGSEFKTLIATSNILLNTNKDDLNAVYFVIPEVKMNRGYYQTQMKIILLGKAKDVRLNSTSLIENGDTKVYNIYFDTQSFISLKSTKQFIRWLGL